MYQTVTGGLNTISFGAVNAADRKNVATENVVGMNVQNTLGYILVFNFLIGPNRISRSVKHLQQFKNVKPEYLTPDDKTEIRRCRGHMARGVIEIIPGAGLLFLLPDLFFSIIRGVINFIKAEKKKKLEIQASQKNYDNMLGIVDSLQRQLNRTNSNPETMKAALLDLSQKYFKELSGFEENLAGEGKPLKDFDHKSLRLNNGHYILVPNVLDKLKTAEERTSDFVDHLSSPFVSQIALFNIKQIVKAALCDKSKWEGEPQKRKLASWKVAYDREMKSYLSSIHRDRRTIIESHDQHSKLEWLEDRYHSDSEFMKGLFTV